MLIWCYYLLSCLVLVVGSVGLVVGVAVFRDLLLVVICLWWVCCLLAGIAVFCCLYRLLVCVC